MNYIQTAIPDVYLLEPKVFGDERGFFMETFRQSDFEREVGAFEFVQENHSQSRQGILRGIHYQMQHPQGKLVRVTQGKVFDIAVDLRKSSPTFKQWVGYELSAENKKQLWVPPGFGHAFYVMSETADFVYKCTNYYMPEHDRSLRWNDQTIAIDWPLVEGALPELSDKDANAPLFDDAQTYD